MIKFILILILFSLVFCTHRQIRPRPYECSIDFQSMRNSSSNVAGTWTKLTQGGTPIQGTPILLTGIFDNSGQMKSEILISTDQGMWAGLTFLQTPSPLPINWILYQDSKSLYPQVSASLAGSLLVSTINHLYVRQTKISYTKTVDPWAIQMILKDLIHTVLFSISTYNPYTQTPTTITAYQDAIQYILDVSEKNAQVVKLNDVKVYNGILFNLVKTSVSAVYGFAFASDTSFCYVIFESNPTNKCFPIPSDMKVTGTPKQTITARGEFISFTTLYSNGAIINLNYDNSPEIVVNVQDTNVQSLKLFYGFAQSQEFPYSDYLFKLDIHSLWFIDLLRGTEWQNIDITWENGATNQDAFFNYIPRAPTLVQTGEPVVIVISSNNQMKRIKNFATGNPSQEIIDIAITDLITNYMILNTASSNTYAETNNQLHIATTPGDVYTWTPQNPADRLLLPSRLGTLNRPEIFIKRVQNLAGQTVPLIGQYEDQWCYAAVTLSILTYVNFAPLPQLCEIVNLYSNPPPSVDCCQMKQDPSCQVGGDESVALKGYLGNDKVSSISAPSPHFHNFKGMLDNNIPVPIDLIINDGKKEGKHVSIITGYSISSGRDTDADLQLIISDSSQISEKFVSWDLFAKGNIIYPSVLEGYTLLNL